MARSPDMNPDRPAHLACRRPDRALPTVRLPPRQRRRAGLASHRALCLLYQAGGATRIQALQGPTITRELAAKSWRERRGLRHLRQPIDGLTRVEAESGIPQASHLGPAIRN